MPQRLINRQTPIGPKNQHLRKQIDRVSTSVRETPPQVCWRVIRKILHELLGLRIGDECQLGAVLWFTDELNNKLEHLLSIPKRFVQESDNVGNSNNRLQGVRVTIKQGLLINMEKNFEYTREAMQSDIQACGQLVAHDSKNQVSRKLEIVQIKKKTIQVSICGWAGEHT